MGVLDEALLGRSIGEPAAIGDSDSFTVTSSFGSNTYTITLTSIVLVDSSTVEVTVDKDGDDGDLNAAPTVTLTMEVQTDFGAVTIYENTEEWFPSMHETVVGSGAGQAGDQVTVTAETDNFDGGFAQVQGVVPDFNVSDVYIVDGSGSISPNPAAEDEQVTFEVDINNDNTDVARFDLAVVDGNGTVWASGTGFEVDVSATISLSAVPQDVGVAPGDYSISMELTDTRTLALGDGFEAVMTNVRPARP